MTDTLTIAARFNGPPGSANGGYTCGLVARRVDADAVEVTLRLPPPLERPLTAVHDGARVELRDGDALVAEGQPSELLLEVPEPVELREIERAEETGLARWTDRHPFPTCVVCGPERDEGDGLRVFPVELPGRNGLYGAHWRPDAALADDDGEVRQECAGEQHSILSWALGREGRKRHAAAALYDSEGRMLCVSRALWIELKSV